MCTEEKVSVCDVLGDMFLSYKAGSELLSAMVNGAQILFKELFWCKRLQAPMGLWARLGGG
jgi:hypothetical protein